MKIKNPFHKAILKDFKARAKTSRDTIKWGLNETAKAAKKDVSKFIRKKYTIKAPDLNKRIDVVKANVKNLSSEVDLKRISRESGKRSPPSLFSFKQPQVMSKTDNRGGPIMGEVIKGKKFILLGAFMKKIKGVDVILMKKEAGQKAARPTTGVSGPSPAGMLAEMQGDLKTTAGRIMDAYGGEILIKILK